jgi:DNA-directed RNA polymerase subunit K/omega
MRDTISGNKVHMGITNKSISRKEKIMFDPSMPINEHKNRYMLAAIIGKRAVQLNKGSKMFIDCESSSNVTIAIYEYKADKLTYINSKDSDIVEQML